MAAIASTLYGTTSKTGSVPNARDAKAATPRKGEPATQETHAPGPVLNAYASDLVSRACDSEPASNPRNAGPAYSEDGKLILSESFTDLEPVPDMGWFEAGLQQLLDSDDFIERWGVWDCYAQDWAETGLTLYRFEMFDLVVRRQGDAVCTWRGAIDTLARLAASSDPEENERNCWQWLLAC